MNKILALLLLTACGDNFAVAPDGNVADAPDDAAPAPERAIVVAGDFTPGNPGVLSVLDVGARTIRTNIGPAMAIGNDPVLRHVGSELLVINRGTSNNVTILDANDFSLVEQLGTGASSNPQDAAVIGNKLYVATFGNKGAVMMTRGSSTITEIDLSVDDPDGKPNCNSIYDVGGELYISCELLDDTQQYLPPRGPGKVYVVNPSSLAVTRTITLANVNPFGLLERLPMFAPNAGDLVIPTIDFANGAGCVERITTGANAASAGCVVTNADLGNFASRIDVYAVEFTGPVAPIVVPAMMYAVVPKADFSGSDLRTYTMEADHVGPDPLNAAGQTIGDVAVCPSGNLVVADTTMASAGLRVYQGTTELTTAPLPVGLRPLSTRGVVCY